MIYVPCNTCKIGRACRDYNTRHELALRRWAHDMSAPECRHYVPLYERGVEGVLVHQGARR